MTDMFMCALKRKNSVLPIFRESLIYKDNSREYLLLTKYEFPFKIQIISFTANICNWELANFCLNPFVHGPRNCQNMKLSLKWNTFYTDKKSFVNILISLLVSEIKPIFRKILFPDFSPSASFWILKINPQSYSHFKFSEIS